MAAHSNILTWRISWTEEPSGLQPIGLQRVGYDRSNLACTRAYLHVCYHVFVSYSAISVRPGDV